MPWVCPSCNSETELGYNVCARCQNPRPGSEAGEADFKLDKDNPLHMIADIGAHFAFLIVAELLIPFLMYRFLGVPLVLGAFLVLAVFGVVVFWFSRRKDPVDADPNGQ